MTNTNSITGSVILYIDDDVGNIGTVDLSTGTVTVLGNAGVTLTDIAFTANGNFYGTSFSGFYSINETTGAATLIQNYGSLGDGDMNALVGAGAGLYAASAATATLYAIDTTPYSITPLSGTVDGASAGDLARSGGALYEALLGGDLDRISLNGSSVSSTLVGDTGNSSIFGLATADNGVTYAVAGTEIYSVNLSTAALTPVLDYSGQGLSSANGTAFFSEATDTAAPVTEVNNADGTSCLYTYNPTSTVAETIATFSAANATGTMISDIVDNNDGTALIYGYNPSSTVTLTSQDWSATNTTNGAPAGAQISDVVDNTDGTALVYAYNPTSTVTQTTQDWSATNAANGAPAGNELSDVVDNSDGTSLLYSYNPTSSVMQTTSEYSATNSANGAPAGSELSDVVDNTDGTAILYAYNPTGSISQTATVYSSYDAGTGAPAGTVTGETADYTNGESAITTNASDGSSSTTYYGGLDGTGSVIGGPATGVFSATPPVQGVPDTVPDSTALTAAAAAPADAAADGAMITTAGSNQFIDLGSGSHTIQFISGGAADTVLLPTVGMDQLLGFDPAAGDTLDLSALLSKAGVNSGYAPSQLSNYVSVVNINGSAEILFDPVGHGGGSQVALLVNDGALVPQLQTLKSFVM